MTYSRLWVKSYKYSGGTYSSLAVISNCMIVGNLLINQILFYFEYLEDKLLPNISKIGNNKLI